MLSLDRQVSLQNILVPTDFSKGSICALEYMLPMVRQFNSCVHVVHVIRSPMVAFTAPGIDAEVRRQARATAQRQLDRLEAMLGDVRHRFWLYEGDIPETIEGLVRSAHIDMIAAGTSGKSNLRKLFLGSVAEEILRTATCPVLLVGPRTLILKPGSVLTQILYVARFWEKSSCGLKYAISIAQQFKARLLFLHVIEQGGPERDDEWLNTYRRRLASLLTDADWGFAADPVLRVESARNVASRILQVAAEVAANLIIMDGPQQEPWANHSPDPVYEVVSAALCPVLSIRANPAAGGSEPEKMQAEDRWDGVCHVGIC